MEYEFKLKGESQDLFEDLIMLANHKRAFEALRGIHSLCGGLSRYINEAEELDVEEIKQEVEATLEEIFSWTHIDGVF